MFEHAPFSDKPISVGYIVHDIVPIIIYTYTHFAELWHQTQTQI